MESFKEKWVQLALIECKLSLYINWKLYMFKKWNLRYFCLSCKSQTTMHWTMELADTSKGMLCWLCAIFGVRKEKLQRNINVINEQWKNMNIKISIVKTRATIIGDTGVNVRIRLGKDVIEQVNIFRYLWWIVNSKGAWKMKLFRE